MNKALIIIPTYNENENILPLIATVVRHNENVHILFVDDNSQDGTVEKIQDESARLPGKISLLQRPSKLGLGSAYRDGFAWGLGRDFDILIEMDADLSHDPVVVEGMIEQITSGQADAVCGSRYVAGGGTVNWGFLRKLISRGGSLYAKLILGLPYQDLTGGYNAWSSKALTTIETEKVLSEGYCFQIELKARAHFLGLRIIELPIIFVDRRAGYSKMSSDIFLEAVRRVWKLRGLKKLKAVKSYETRRA